MSLARLWRQQDKIAEVQNVQQRKLDLEKATIEAAKESRLQAASHKRDQARKAVNDTYRITTLVFAVVPGLLLGIATWLRRSSRAASIVPANRRTSVGGGK